MSAERPLEGKVAVVTGASRGIGREIALKLAEAGANIVGNSVDPDKQKRVDETKAEIEKRGGKVKWVLADISTPVGRALLGSAAMNLATETNGGDGVDYVFLNAAGGLEAGKEDDWATKINVDSQLALVNSLRGIMNPGAAFIYETSLWAHNFGKAEQPPFYRPIAKTKYLAERRLRELTPVLDTEGIRMGFLVGHIIKGTGAHTLMARSFPEYAQKIEQTAEGGKFPTAEDMGEAALRMLLSTGFIPGYTEYVGGQTVIPIDPRGVEEYVLDEDKVKSKLPMYGNSKLYVTNFESPAEDETLGRKETGLGIYWVRLQDTEGHFAGEYDDIRLFRGVDEIEAAAQTLGLVFLGLEPLSGFVPYLKGIKAGGVDFSGFVTPGEILKMEAKITRVNPQNGVRGNVEIKIEGETIAQINGIELGLIPNANVARRAIERQKSARYRTGSL